VAYHHRDIRIRYVSAFHATQLPFLRLNCLPDVGSASLHSDSTKFGDNRCKIIYGSMTIIAIISVGTSNGKLLYQSSFYMSLIQHSIRIPPCVHTVWLSKLRPASFDYKLYLGILCSDSYCFDRYESQLRYNPVTDPSLRNFQGSYP